MSDLISRKALKKYMRDYKWEFALNSDFSKAIEMVDVQPTVEAKEVVHGEWTPFYEDVEVYNSGGFTRKSHTGYICSICGKGFTTHYTNFCPNCGADMRKKV